MQAGCRLGAGWVRRLGCRLGSSSPPPPRRGGAGRVACGHDGGWARLGWAGRCVVTFEDGVVVKALLQKLDQPEVELVELLAVVGVRLLQPLEIISPQPFDLDGAVCGEGRPGRYDVRASMCAAACHHRSCRVAGRTLASVSVPRRVPAARVRGAGVPSVRPCGWHGGVAAGEAARAHQPICERPQ